MKKNKFKEIITFDSFNQDLLIAIEIKLANGAFMSEKELEYLEKWYSFSTICNHASLEDLTEIKR
jgi:hypothetical protein